MNLAVTRDNLRNNFYPSAVKKPFFHFVRLENPSFLCNFAFL
jgi:hypothetical protein